MKTNKAWKMKRVGSGLWAVVLAVVVAGCTTNEAGRRQLMIVPESEMTQLGLTSFEQLKKETPISKDPALNDLVRRVGERIKSVVDMPNAQWEFVVFESKEPNAFCLPGGKIGIYTGILPITKDEAGLATVMGHEVAHAVLQHGRERMSEGLALNVVGQGLGKAVNAADPRWLKPFEQVYGIGSQVTVALPHSRAQELEADSRGVIYMAKAGYDPEAAVGFWQRFSDFMKQAGGSSTPGFLRTHPMDATRIKNLQDKMPEAKAVYRPR
jgi:predicted Zn-dependent protease